MKKRSWATLSLFAVAATLGACGKKDGAHHGFFVDQVQEGITGGAADAYVSGKLLDAVKANQKSKLSDPCEKAMYKSQRDLATALDQRAASIAQFVLDQGKTAKTAKEIGKSVTLIERDKVASPQKLLTWADAISTYQTIQSASKPVTPPADPAQESTDSSSSGSPSSASSANPPKIGPNKGPAQRPSGSDGSSSSGTKSQQPTLYTVDQGWVDLYNEVAELIREDSRRLTAPAVNLYIGPDAQPKIEKVLPKVQACAEDAGCDSLSLDSADADFLKSNPFYSNALDNLGRARTQNRKRETIMNLAKRLQADDSLFTVTANPAVKRTGANELTLSLDSGQLSDGADQLKAMIESTWTSSSLSVKIVWAHADAPNANPKTHVVALNVGATPGLPSAFQGPDKPVIIQPMSSPGSVNHVIGHLLGLPDHRYDKFDKDACGYVVTTDAGDIMAEPDSGGVTDAEWKLLDQAYPVSK